MEQAVQTLQQQLHALQQHVQVQAQQLAAAAAPAPAPAPRTQEPRLPPPPRFLGSLTPSLDAWTTELRRQFAYGNVVTDADRLRVAAAWLGGAALDWWEHLPDPPATWVAFVAALRHRFQVIDSAQVARDKLATITQGKRTVNEYSTAFRELLSAVPTMHADDRLSNFMRGLKASIAQELRMRGVVTLEAAIETAARYASVSEQTTAAHSAASVAAAQRADAPMDLDAIEGLEADTDAPLTRAEKTMMQEFLHAMREERKSPHRGGAGGAGRGGYVPRGPPRISRLTEEQVKEYMEKDMCFNCDKIGHQSRQCPNKKRWGK